MSLQDLHDLELIIKSHIPIVVVESHEERRIVELCKRLMPRIGTPVYQWTVTEGLHRLEKGFSPQRHTIKPTELLAQIKSTTKPGTYLLIDFHPYLSDPTHVRYLKEIAQRYDELGHTIVLVSHRLEIPPELTPLCARFSLKLPDAESLRRLVAEEATAWARRHPSAKVKTDRQTLDLLVRNLTGLSESDAKRVIRAAIYDDGAITDQDLGEVVRRKHALLSPEGILSFEYDTARFSEVAGLARLRQWLEKRKPAFDGGAAVRGLDAPRGILLVGVQGCGKSLAAKAVAGLWGVPLLRLDLGSLYNKFFGETERNVRETLRAAEAMSPCVLWVDEIEKGLSAGDYDSGTSKRVLGTMLTWMAENTQPVFMVATANDIEALPPELVRKGRLDEIFFVDLPTEEVRRRIFEIHLVKRNLDPARFDLERLSEAAPGYSGAEIEQAVVSACYSAVARGAPADTALVLDELSQTRPLSVVMAEKIEALRAWAFERTVPAD